MNEKLEAVRAQVFGMENLVKSAAVQSQASGQVCKDNGAGYVANAIWQIGVALTEFQAKLEVMSKTLEDAANVVKE